MQRIVVPVAFWLLLYAPGHYLLRGRHSAEPFLGSRLFREVLLSVGCASWMGFVLAELGLYSLAALLSCLATVSVAAGFLSRPSRPWPYRGADLAGVGVVLLTWLWVSPPLDTRILGADSAGYLASGISLSRHGSLIIHDATLPLLSADLKRSLFPSVTLNPGSPPYLRLAGSFVLRSLDADEVLPAFHHLIAVWIAVFYGLAGSAAVGWVITLFAGLSMWAMVEFATTMGGTLTGLSLFLLLLLCSVQDWYSRFLMPEIPAQLFVWGGLCCTSFSSRSGRRTDAILAGIAFGLAGLMRMENAAFLFVALVIVLGCAPTVRSRTHVALLVGPAVALWLHAILHLIVFRTHYLGNLRTLFPETLSLFSHASPAQLAFLAATVAGLLLWRRRGRAQATLGPYSILLAAVAVCVSFWGDWRHDWSSLNLLTWYLGIPTVLSGGIGLALCAKNADRRSLPQQLFLLLTVTAFAQFMLAPHATPVPIWTIRRVVTIIAPAFCLGTAWLCRSSGQRWRWPVPALLFALAVAGQAIPLANLRRQPYYQNGSRHVEAVAAMLPPGACVLFDRQLLGSGFAPALWAERDLPAYFISPRDVRQTSDLLRSLDGVPLYWLSNDTTAPLRIPGLVVTPIALYQFRLATPALDVGSIPGASSVWDSEIAIYALHIDDTRPDGLGGWSDFPGLVKEADRPR